MNAKAKKWLPRLAVALVALVAASAAVYFTVRPIQRAVASTIAQVGDGKGKVEVIVLSSSMRDGLYSYNVYTKSPGGPLRAHATIPREVDSSQMAAYIEANRAEAQRLAEEARGELIDVTVTFARPLSVDDVEPLVAAAGMEVRQYFDLGIGPICGKAGGGGGFSGNWDDVRAALNEKLTTVELRRRRTEIGLMALKGHVPAEGLPVLLADSRVFLVDVMAREIKEDAAHHLGVAPEDIMLQGMPTPYWRLW